jgi:maltokinase
MAPSTDILGLLAPWLGAQRWFGGKGHAPRLRRIGGWELAARDVRIRTHLVMDDSGSEPTLYQIPVTERRRELAGAEHALIGMLDGEHGIPVYVYDAPHDPGFREALLRLILNGSTAVPDGAEAEGVAFLSDGESDPRIVTSRVLSGEQSNTSIIYELAGSRGTERAICKVFRALHHGDNPDVVLQVALAAAGSPHVPHPIGCVLGNWDDVGRPDGRAHGHLAFAQEFFPGAEDGWRLALRKAAAHNDFTARSRALGVVTADVHATLASALPTFPATDADIDAAIASWQRRLQLAVAEVPAIAEFGELIERVYQAARHLSWPRLQRVHGDYHLGQVLAGPDGRWIVLDFEGEPLRPMVERSRPDFPVRDVAGMLRSFDYIAGSLSAGENADDWAADNRRAFLDGYVERSGINLRENRGLLDAFETDKAIYEAVYEARNRPGWLPIPTAAIRRLADRSRSALQ